MNIYYFSSIYYDFLFQRPQQLFEEMSSIAPKGCNVYYVEPISSCYNLTRYKNNSKNILKNGFYIPFKNRINIPWLGKISKKIMLNQLGIRKRKDAINVGIISNCYYEHFVNKDIFDIIAYDCLDAIEVYAKNNDYDKYKRLHCKLLEKSDLVFVTSKILMDDILKLDPKYKVVMVSNGVNTKYFEENKNKIKIKDYQIRGRKIIGYVGAIYDWIDLDLVFQVANELSEVDFVLVGPVHENYIEYVDRKPGNVFFLGTKPYEEVPSYIEIFDIAIIPFKNNIIADSTDPIKLYEYFSLGKAVIATNMFQLRQYNSGFLLKIASDSKNFAGAINEFIENDNEKWRNERKRIASENSWNNKAKIIIDSIIEVKSRT